MSAEWFYLRDGWFRRSQRVGPVTDSDLLARIDEGTIRPETLIQSRKTRNQWVPMSSVGPAMDRWLKSHPEGQDE